MKAVAQEKSCSKKQGFDKNNFKIWEYLKIEMFGIGEPGHMEPPSGKENLNNFFFVPLMLEHLLGLGLFASFDAFLYVITFLPIRFLFSFYLLIVECIYIPIEAVHRKFKMKSKKDKKKNQYRFNFHRTHTYDLMRGIMIIAGTLFLRQINMSRVYHFIRGQGVVKLYVLTAMLETMDKLLSSFGIDMFDALHWQTRTNPKSLMLIGRFIIVLVYVCLHAGLYFFQVATVTVVINSADTQLQTVLILNNFSELRTFVFKKFDVNNLFQLSCSDITERFQMMLFLGITLHVAIAQSGEQWKEAIPIYSKVVTMFVIGEIVADSVKHAFICKFNSIDPKCYNDFSFIISRDILSNRTDSIILDHTYSVTRRLGLSQVILHC
jgi:hypothetical protein